MMTVAMAQAVPLDDERIGRRLAMAYEVVLRAARRARENDDGQEGQSEELGSKIFDPKAHAPVG